MTTTFSKNDFELIKREVLYKGVFCFARYHLRFRLFNGGWSDIITREVLERYSAAGVLPYDPVSDRVILIEQFRPGSLLSNPCHPWLIEVPAGVLVGNDNVADLAIREAHEEAGCHISELRFITDYYVSPGASNEFLTLYCGKVDATHVNGVHGLKHEGEDIRVINLPAEEAFAKLHAGEIKTSPAIISLLWLELNRDRLRQDWG